MKVLLALLTAFCLLSGIALAAGGTAEDSLMTANPPSESFAEPPVETDMGASVDSGGADTETSQGADLDAPPESDPEAPTESDPEAPAESGPENSEESSPDIPAESDPEVPAESDPEVPEESNPDSPAENTPEGPVGPAGTAEVPEPTPGPHSFVRTRIYAGQFSDLTEDATFYTNVAALYEYGLSVGQKDGTYGLKEPATVSQCIIFSARLRSLYDNGDAEAGAASFRQEGQRTYESYLLYLQSRELLGDELEGLYFTHATRATMAHLLISTLPEEVFTPLNQDVVIQGYAARRYIQDVNEYTPYFQDILALYRYGICQGVDESGTFLPDETITRGALAAMLTRIVDPTLQIRLDWDLDSAQGITWGALVTDRADYVAAPYTAKEFDSTVSYMLSLDSLTLELNYDRPVDGEFAASVLHRCLASAGKHSENMLNRASCTYHADSGKMTLNFSLGNSSPEATALYRADTLDAAIAVHDYLWDSGALTEDMSQLQKARVYFNWICENCSYDALADDSSLSHTAYSLFTFGTAVCDGYTGAYNLLLKLEGIRCYTQTGSDHAWTVATLDGAEYHIDTTWGDSGISADLHYFAMPPEISYEYHPW